MYQHVYNGMVMAREKRANTAESSVWRWYCIFSDWFNGSHRTVAEISRVHTNVYDDCSDHIKIHLDNQSKFMFRGFSSTPSRQNDTDDFEDGFKIFQSNSKTDTIESQDIRIYDAIWKRGDSLYDEFLSPYKGIIKKDYFINVLKQIDRLECRIQPQYDLIQEHPKLPLLLARLTEIDDAYSEAVQDVLVLSLLHFSRVNRNKNHVKLLSFQITCMNRVFEILSTYKEAITSKKPRYYWNVLTSKKYTDSNVVQRMFVLSQVLNMKENFYSMVRSDTLYDALYGQKDLFKWLINSGGKFEQDYLNSCASTTIVNEILTFNHTITCLFLLSDEMIVLVKDTLSGVENDKIKEYAQKLLDKASENLRETRVQLKNLLGYRFCEEKDIRTIVLQWSKSIQELCLLLDPNQIAAPTRNSWKSNYHVSTVLSMFQILSKKDESLPPRMDMYIKGSNFMDIQEFLDDFLIVRRISKVVFAWDLEDWKTITFQFGNPISREDLVFGSHQMYIRTAYRGKEKLFLVFDPLVVGILEMTLDEMKEYAKVNKVEIE
jgi:hypothetical protein